MSAPLSRPDPAQDPVLQRFAASVRALYGARLDRILLFGSRARGDARADSDYDVAVFLRDPRSMPAERQRLFEITSDILDQTGAEINSLLIPASDYRRRTPLMHEIRGDGRDLLAPAPRPRRRRTARRPGRSRRMSPEAAHYLRAARTSLADARLVLDRALTPAVAAREAYIALLSAARAVIWQRTGRIAKTHSGTRGEISRLAHEDSRIDTGFARALARGFDLKLIADYDAGERSAITRAVAEAGIAEAARLIAHAEWLLSQPDPSPPA